jgi:hypothetical protein
MPLESWLTLAATLGTFAFMNPRTYPRIWWAQSITLACALWLLFGYYSPLVPKLVYEWMVWSSDIMLSIYDLWAIAGLVGETGFLRRATEPERVATILLLHHQWVKLRWHHGSDLFHWPASALQHMRFASNLAYLAALVVMYKERAHMRQGETHATPSAASL